MAVFGKTSGESTIPTKGGGPQKKEFEAIPAGTYNAEVVSVKYQLVDKEICYWKKYDDEFVFEFRITDGPYAKRRFWADVRAEISDWEGCRLRLYLQEILGVNELPDGFELDTDNLGHFAGLPCRIRVNQYHPKAKPEITKNGVEDVLAATAAQINAQQSYDENPF